MPSSVAAANDRNACCAASPPAVGEPARDPYLDNAKLLLVLLVVVGHCVGELMRSNALAKGVFLWIYTFHMPAFVFVAGLLSKGASSPERRLRLVARTLAPYLIFQIAYRVAYHLLFGTATLELRPFRPDFSLWFLVSLFFWRAMTPYLRLLPRALALSVAVGLLVGVVGDTHGLLGGARTLVLLPFFVAGLLVRRDHLRALQRPWVRGLAVLLLGAALAFALWAAPQVDERPFFYGSTSYTELGLSLPWGAARRLALYAAAAVLGAAVLALVPRRRLVVTTWGRRSLYVYLLHTFVVRAIQSERLDKVLAAYVSNPALQALVAAALAVTLTVLLSQRWVARLFWPVVEPRPQWVRRGALPVALALLLVAAPASLRYWGATRVDLSALSGRAPGPTGAAGNARVTADRPGARPPVALGPGGLMVDLGRRRHARRLRMSVTPGRYGVTLYRANRSVLSTTVSGSRRPGPEPGEHAVVTVALTPRARRRGFDLLVIERDPDDPTGSAPASVGHLELARPGGAP